MTTTPRTRDATPNHGRDAVLDGMCRSGASRERLDEARHVLPDPVDMGRDDELLARLGFDQNSRVHRMGGRP